MPADEKAADTVGCWKRVEVHVVDRDLMQLQDSNNARELGFSLQMTSALCRIRYDTMTLGRHA